MKITSSAFQEGANIPSKFSCDGANTSPPEDVQLAMLHSIPALSHCEMVRVGYAVGAPGSEPLLRRLAPPLGLAEPQQAGALEALHACAGQIAARREQVVVERRRLLDELTNLPVDAAPSQANVLWLRAPGLSGLELADRLRRNGVIVAPGAAVGADEHVRATIQGRAASDRLLEALRKVAEA